MRDYATPSDELVLNAGIEMSCGRIGAPAHPESKAKGPEDETLTLVRLGI